MIRKRIILIFCFSIISCSFPTIEKEIRKLDKVLDINQHNSDYSTVFTSLQELSIERIDSMGMGDFSGDDDLEFTCSNYNETYILSSKGTILKSFQIPEGYEPMAFGDIDGDQKHDMIYIKADPDGIKPLAINGFGRILKMREEVIIEVRKFATVEIQLTEKKDVELNLGHDGELIIKRDSEDILIFFDSNSTPLDITGLSHTMALEQGEYVITSIKEGYAPKIDIVEVLKNASIEHSIVLNQYNRTHITDFDDKFEISLDFHGNGIITTLENKKVVSISPLANTNNSKDRQLKGVWSTYSTQPDTTAFSLHIDAYFNFIDSDQRLFFDFLISPNASNYTAYAYGWNFMYDTDNIKFDPKESLSNYDISNISQDFHRISLHIVDSYAIFMIDNILVDLTEINSIPSFESPIKSWFGLENDYSLSSSTFSDDFILNEIVAYY